MSAIDLLLRGRARAEELMVDECIIRRPGEVVTDPDTGVVTNTADVVYQGKCKVQSKNSATSRPEAGGAVFTVVSRQVHVPANAADVLDNDVIEITASELNPMSVGKQYRVDGFTPDTFDTAFRIPVKEIL